MKLTTKDREFLEKLKAEIEGDGLHVELRRRPLSYMVLRRNYGSRIETLFGLTRQGVRWRFNHIFNEAYVSAYECILAIESSFGPHLRQMATQIAKDRARQRNEARSTARIKPP